MAHALILDSMEVREIKKKNEGPRKMYDVAPGVLITQRFLLSTDPLLGPQAAAYGPTDTQTHIKPMRLNISLCNAGAILHNHCG